MRGNSKQWARRFHRADELLSGGTEGWAPQDGPAGCSSSGVGAGEQLEGRPLTWESARSHGATWRSHPCAPRAGGTTVPQGGLARKEAHGPGVASRENVLCAQLLRPTSPAWFLSSDLSFQVEVKEGGGAVPSESVEEASLQNPPSQEPCKFPCPQDAEDALGGSQKDGGTMVTLTRERLLCGCGACITVAEPTALVVPVMVCLLSQPRGHWSLPNPPAPRSSLQPYAARQARMRTWLCF